MKPWTLLDKLLWQFMRWATKFSVRPLTFAGITPNQLTVLSSIINFSAAAFCFAQGTYWWNIAGLIFLLLHSYFDFADGALARAIGKTSKSGAWLDGRLDIIGAEAVAVGIIVGVIRSNPGLPWLLIAAAVVFGRLGVLTIVFDYERTVYSSSDFLEKFNQEKKMTIVDKLIKEFITFQSFPFLFIGTFRYFLTLAVILDQLKVFIVVSAIFNNLRWLIMFWAYAQALNGQKSRFKVVNLLAEYLKN